MAYFGLLKLFPHGSDSPTGVIPRQEPAIPGFSVSITIPIPKKVLDDSDTDFETQGWAKFDTDSDTDTKTLQML